MKSRYRFLSIVGLFLGGMSLPVFAAPPANDNFAAATVVSPAVPVTVLGTNVEATLELNEPLPAEAGGSAEGSVWFNWTPSANSSVQIDTFGSDFDTVLAVWNGNSVDSLTQLAENDDYWVAGQSTVFMDVISGVTYRIAVYGVGAERGSITLNITNDVTSRITGTVTATNGITPLQGIEVQASQFNGTSWEAANVDVAYTDAAGYYEIRGLTAGTYWVEFRDLQTGDYQYQVYSNAVDLDAGTSIIVGVSETVLNINASLTASSKITGTVTGPDAVTGLEGIYVQAYSWNGTAWDSVSGAYTAPNGFYEIAGLTGGTYRVQFEDLVNGIYASEAYDNALDLDSGSDIPVGVASTVANIDASLGIAVVAARIVNCARTGVDEWSIYYTGTAGANYILQETTSLTGTWQNVGSTLVSGAGTNSVVRSSTATSAFWRIRTDP